MFLNSYNNKNITFCGMMGSGKSVIGKKLAKIINFGFLDTDTLIEENMGKSINQIFIENGEEQFRELEEKIIIKSLNKKKFVISLGGGAIVNKKIRKKIKKNSFNIYLEVKIDILTKRLAFAKNRPLINDKNIKKKLIELMNTREIFYKQADLIIKNEINLSETINKIINNLNK